MKRFLVMFSIFTFMFASAVPLKAFAQTTEGEAPWAGRDREQIREWRLRSSSISKKIDKLDQNRVENVPVPILFGITPDNITPNFGDPRSGGRTHEGEDIMAPRRALVVSPTPAVVLRTGSGESSGKYVYTANPGGETFAYMHLDEIADINEGDELAVGDFIGYVGNTGNASGGATHLHFEIRHDRGATDPYPRLKRIFPLADKIKYLSQILNNADDAKNLSERIVVLYRKELILAKTLNIILPATVEAALITIPTTLVASSTSNNTSTNGDLKLGSRGAAVVTLQKFLISKNIGSANKVVADGSFGPITQKALADYQASVGIKPAAGYYGPITRAYITSHP